MIIFGNETQE